MLIKSCIVSNGHTHITDRDTEWRIIIPSSVALKEQHIKLLTMGASPLTPSLCSALQPLRAERDLGI